VGIRKDDLMENKHYKKIRIFAASTNDLQDERNRLRLVVDELNRGIADRFGLTLELLDWATHTRPTMGRPQGIIFDQIPLDEWDIFIGILWYRFGTPPGKANPIKDTPFLSGTEEEFTAAYQSWKKSGLPDILFYRCIREIPVDADADQLKHVQDFFKEFDVSGTHSGLYDPYETVEEFERRVREHITDLIIDYGKEQLKDTRKPELAKAIEEIEETPKSKKNVVSSLHLPFTNREDEIRQITSSLAPAYHLIDAPAGYGKTVFLREIQKRFDEQNWKVVYISIRENGNIPDIAKKIADEFGVKINACKDATQWGLDLGKVIIEKHQQAIERNNANQKSGVILLLDIDKRGWASLLPIVDKLVQKFIPSLEYNLREFQSFTSQQNPFRVVLAGRYLAGKTSSPFELPILRLTPFNYRVVSDTVRKYLPHESNIKQLAAHLIYYTAGHPGCIARVLERYKSKGYPVDEFFKYEEEVIWEEIVWREADAVYKDIPRGLRRIFKDLSVFRYLDYDILGRLLDGSTFSDYEDPYNLADKLTQTFLMGREGRLLHDSITRRLLALWLWRDIGKQSFASYCQRAYSICLEKLQNQTTQLLEKWAIECMFQFLQEHVEIVQDGNERKNLRREFFSKVVPDVLDKLLTDRDTRTELSALLLEMENDWEFRFTVNYYLRENQFTDEPYLKLKQYIEVSKTSFRGDSYA